MTSANAYDAVESEMDRPRQAFNDVFAARKMSGTRAERVIKYVPIK